MICVNINHPDFVNLQEVTGLNEDVLRAKVGVWMEKNPSGSFPTLDDLGLEVRTEPTPDMFEQTEEIQENEDPGFFNVKQKWDSKPETDVDPRATSKSTVTYLKQKPLNLSPEDKVKFDYLVEAVGYDEAFKDVIEQNGKVRSPEYVIDKILFEKEQQEEIDEESQIINKEVNNFDAMFQRIPDYSVDELTMVDAIVNIADSQNKQKATDVMVRLSNQLGVDYEVITEEEFNDMFPDVPKAAGFFKKGKVYFIAGLFDHNTVFHEFCHPIIKAMAKQNPALFNKLYSDLAKSEDGFDLFSYVAKYYPEYQENSPEFMEEVIVQAMERMNKDFGYEKKSWFKEILFNIKQFLRKVFGRGINISKLTPNTTLEELVDMLNQGEVFKFDKNFINKDDVVMFQRMYQQEVNDVITKTTMEVTQQTIDDFYELVQKQVGNLTKENSIFATLKFELSDDFNEGDLQILRKNLNEISSKGSRATKRLEFYDSANPTDAEIIRHKIELFVTALAHVDTVFEKLNKKINTLNANNLSKDDFEVMLAMQMYIENWENFYLNISKGYFQSFNIDDPISKLYSRSKSKVESLSTKLKQTFTDAIFDEFYDHLQKINEPIEREALEELDALKNSGKYSEYERRYKQWYGITPGEKAELDALERTSSANRDENRYLYLKHRSMFSQSVSSKQQIKALIGNTLGDVNGLTSVATGYINNADFIVGGFHNYISQFFNEISGNANARQAELLLKLKEKLKGTKYDGKLTGEGELGLAVGKKDAIYLTNDGLSEKESDEWSKLSIITNKTPEQQKVFDRLSLKKLNLEVSEEYVFANNFKNWRADKKLLESKIEQAKLDYTLKPSVENEKAFKKAVKLYNQWNANYMNRDGVDEVYQYDYMFDSPIGEMAQEKIDDVFNRMRMLTANTMADPTSFDIEFELTKLWVEFRQLYSKTDLNGNDKTGDDLAIAELLNEFKEKTKDFYDYVDIPMKFDNSFDTFLENLNASQNIQGNERKVAIEKWLKYNTTVEIDDSYFEKREQLLAQREVIMAQLTALNNSIQDVSAEYTKLYTDILKPTKNEMGQYSGLNLTRAQQRIATQLAEKIDKAKDSYLQLSGLTGQDYKDYVYLKTKLMYGTLTVAEELRYDDLESIISQQITQGFGIGFQEYKKLRDIDNELRAMSRTEATDDYVAAFNNIVFNDPVLLAEFRKEILDSFGDDIVVDDTFQKEHLEELLTNVNLMGDFMQKSNAFADFFLSNHYVAERVQYNTAGQSIGVAEMYVKSPAWTTTVPKDLNYYHTRPISNNPFSPQQGLFSNGYLELDGIPRVPNMTYRHRQIKPEFLREKIERDYVEVDPVTGAERLVIANVDNSGRWLPKTREANPNDDRYIDEDYQDMFENNRKIFDAMLMLKDHHLDNQNKLDASQKIYISYPNIRKGGLQTSFVNTVVLDKRNEGRVEYLATKWRTIVNLFRNQADDVELGFIGDPKIEEPLSRPISGLYHLNANEVSTNIVASIGLQSYSIEHFKAARKAMPFMQLFNRTINEIATSPEIQQYRNKIQTLKLFKTDLAPKDSKRLKAIQNSIDKHLKGEETIISKDSVAPVSVQKFYTKLMGVYQKFASLLWFSYNATSSSTNYGTGKVSIYAKSFLKNKNFKLIDLVMTRIKSFKTIMKLMNARYKRGEIDPMIQLLRVTDAIPDLMKKDAGTFGARSLWADLWAGTLRFSDRKYMGDSVPVHMYLAILRRNSFMLNGKKTALYDAITLDNKGRVITVPGVPSEMSISYDADGKIIMGEKLKKISNVQQNYTFRTIGAINDFNEPEAFRHIYAKSTFFIMKFIPGLLVNYYNMRFNKRAGVYGTATKNFSTGERELGVFSGTTTAIISLLNSKRKLNNAQKTALFAFLIYLSADLMLRLLNYGYLRRYDEDDDGEDDFYFSPGVENMHSMMAKMNAVPDMPFVRNDSGIRTVQNGYRFSKEEWFKMNALRITNRMIKEQESMLPFVPWDPYNSGIVPTVINLFTSGSAVGEENILKHIYKGLGSIVNGETYEQDAGPYFWQEGITNEGVTEGQKPIRFYHNKAFNVYMKYRFGLDGKITNPAYGLKQDHTLR